MKCVQDQLSLPHHRPANLGRKCMAFVTAMVVGTESYLAQQSAAFAAAPSARECWLQPRDCAQPAVDDNRESTAQPSEPAPSGPVVEPLAQNPQDPQPNRQPDPQPNPQDPTVDEATSASTKVEEPALAHHYDHAQHGEVQAVVGPEPSHADRPNNRHAGVGEIVVGSTLAGLGAVSGVLSIVTAVQAYDGTDESGVASNRERPPMNFAVLGKSPWSGEVSGGAQRESSDGNDANRQTSPRNKTELQRLSLGFALGAGVLLSAGGILIHRGIVAHRQFEVYVRPVVSKRRSLVQVRAKF